MKSSRSCQKFKWFILLKNQEFKAFCKFFLVVSIIIFSTLLLIIQLTRLNQYIFSDQFTFSQFLDGIPQDDGRILEHIRKYHIFEPFSREIPYNLTNSSVEDPSEGQTTHVIKLLNGLKGGFFIETGAHDGEIMSNTLALERHYNWTGILIEPQPIEFKNLQNKRRKAWLSNVCMSPQNTPLKMEFLQRADGFTIGSRLGIGMDTPLQFRDLFQSINIHCFPIYSILASLNVTTVDYFSLDVEGIELNVLRTIPFDKILFKVITVEVQFLGDEKIVLKNFMEKNNFTFVTEMYLDYIFVHKTVKTTQP